MKSTRIEQVKDTLQFRGRSNDANHHEELRLTHSSIVERWKAGASILQEI